jgi:WS/DGAT/MGAT family acyltransferase
VADALFDRMRDYLQLYEQFWRAALDPAAAALQATRIARTFEKAAPYFAVLAVPAPWNFPLTKPSRLAWQALPFDEVHDAARALGGTINDVVLTTLAGALRRYLEDEGHATEGRVLRAALPVNVRREDEAHRLGNRISFMLLSLPVGERDPRARFASIHAEAQSLKDAGQAAGLDELAGILGGLPPITHRLLGQTLTAPNTLANLICTNIAGPLVPLYCMGHRMIAHFPWAPLGWRMGLNVAVMSYDAQIFASFCADERVPGDLGRLAGFFVDEFTVLRAELPPPAYRRGAEEAVRAGDGVTAVAIPSARSTDATGAGSREHATAP